MARKKKGGPGKFYRRGISIMELSDMFPDEQSAVEWFEGLVWPTGRCCGHCGSTDTKEAPKHKMPYWCRDCRSHFSVRTGTVVQSSRLPLRKWVWAIYIYVTNLKGVSSMKLHRDLDVTQKTAWYMLHRIRQAWADEDALDGMVELMMGPLEVDETYIGGKRKNMSKSKRFEIAQREKRGRGATDKTPVVGMKDRATNQVRAKVVRNTGKQQLHGFIGKHAHPSATLYTDDATVYKNLPFAHESVNHSVAEYVRGQAHTNGIESFWAALKRGYQGTFHHMSVKHLPRYITEFAGRHNVRSMDTIAQMQDVVAGMIGKRLMYRDLIGR